MIPGLVGKAERFVGKEDLVQRLGPIDLDVLSTPKLIEILEAAAIQAIKPHLHPDELTVGTHLSVKHLAPTPLGMKVTAHALLKEVDGNRLFFLVDAYDEIDKVAEGEHERMVVSKERFLEKVNRKKGRDNADLVDLG